jgi:hypothetical protein
MFIHIPHIKPTLIHIIEINMRMLYEPGDKASEKLKSFRKLNNISSVIRGMTMGNMGDKVP